MAEQNNQQKKGGQQQDANQLIQVRYDKLHELQANGKNPFEITKYDVTHHSTDIKDNFESLEGKISNESPVGHALIGKKINDVVDVETQAGVIQYKVLDIKRS